MRWLLFVGLILLAGTASADSGYLDVFFNIPSSDQSVGMLRMIFGDMGTVLYGQENAFNFMFRSFNEAMLILNVFVIAYTTIFGLVNTAHEGEFLGKKLNSVWVPLRSVLGIALLVPTKTGYCVIQLFLMWIVLQGVGAADTIWGSALNAINTLGSEAVLPSTSAGQNPGQNVDPTISLATSNSAQAVALGLVCGHEYIQNNGGTYGGDNWAPTLSTSGGNYVMSFNPPTSLTGIAAQCGEAHFPQPSSFQPSAPEYYIMGELATDLNVMVGILNESAKEYVYNGTMAGDPLGAGSNIFTTALRNGYADYISNNPTVSGSSCDATHPESLYCAAQNGWAFAGAYERVLTTHVNTLNPQNLASYLSSNFAVSSPSQQGIFDQAAQTSFKNAASAAHSASGSSTGNLLSDLTKLSGFSASSDFGKTVGAPVNAATDWIVDAFVMMLTGTSSDIVNGQFTPSGSDPIQGIQIFGERVINIVELIWVILLGVIALGVIVTAAFEGLNPFTGVAFVLLKIASFFLFFFGLLFAIGLVMAVYIPLIPFIIFFFAVLGWLIAVIETMLAAPMVAIGITYPEGHDILGRADPAVMLVTNVFVRPSLMIFGLIGGILLSSVALTLLNTVYQFVIMTTTQTAGNGGLQGYDPKTNLTDWGIGPFQLISYIVIYIVIVIVIINRSFALIHQIPDNVLRWIGGQHGFGEYAKGEDEVSGQAKSGMGQTAAPAQQIGEGLNSAASKAWGGGKKDGGGGAKSEGSSGASDNTDLHSGGDAGAGGA